MKKKYIKPSIEQYLVTVYGFSELSGHDETSENDDVSKGTGGSNMWEYMDDDEE